MANDTKIGLVVGLAFIICFAVVLANRGGREALSEQLEKPKEKGATPTAVTWNTHSGRSKPLAERQAPVQTRDEGTRGRRDAGNRSGKEEAPSSPTVTMTLTQEGADGETRVVGGDPATTGRHSAEESQMAASIGSRDFEQLAESLRHGRANGADSAVRHAGHAVGSNAQPVERPHLADASTTPAGQGAGPAADAGSSQEPNAEALQRAINSIHMPRGTALARNDLPGAVNGTNLSAVPPGEQPQRDAAERPVERPKPAAPARTHTVVAGDTLTKVAQQAYGTKSPAVIEAIYAANRGVLKSKDVLRLGQVLTLPELPASMGAMSAAAEPTGDKGAADRTSATPDAAAKRAAPTAGKDTSVASKGGAVRWYQVRKGDTYVKIARTALGDERRWREIHELNKGVFPDPSAIREGVKIKLPETMVADARPRP